MPRKKSPLTELKAVGNAFIAEVYHAGFMAGYDAAKEAIIFQLTGTATTKKKKRK